MRLRFWYTGTIFCVAFANDFSRKQDKELAIAHPVDHDMLLTIPLIFAVEGRLALLNLNLKDVVHTADCDLEKIAELTEGYSGADITNVCRFDFTIHMNITSESRMIRYQHRKCKYTVQYPHTSKVANTFRG